MINASQITEHMEVISSDGGHVGKVDHVHATEIELARFDTSTLSKHKMIPLSWVDHIDEHVHLNVTKDQAKERWTDKLH